MRSSRSSVSTTCTAGIVCTFFLVLVAVSAGSFRATAHAESSSASSTPPVVVSIITTDANADGSIDTAEIIFNEAMLLSSLAPCDFTIGTTTVSTITASSTNHDAYTFIIAGGTAGTDKKTVAYNGASATDTDGDVLATFSQLSTDAAGPVPLSARTIDTTHLAITFSEKILSSSVSNSDFAVAGNTVVGKQVTTDVVTLTLGTAIGPGDTPAVTVHGNGSSGVEDFAKGNWSPREYTLMPVDDIAPGITSVSTASNNATTTLAHAGDTVTFHFTSSETISPIVTIGAQIATTRIDEGDNTWEAYRVMSGTGERGLITFSITYSDDTGNIGAPIATTTDGSFVWYDADSVVPVIVESDDATTTEDVSDSIDTDTEPIIVLLPVVPQGSGDTGEKEGSILAMSAASNPFISNQNQAKDTPLPVVETSGIVATTSAPIEDQTSSVTITKKKPALLTVVTEPAVSQIHMVAAAATSTNEAPTIVVMPALAAASSADLHGLAPYVWVVFIVLAGIGVFMLM